MRANTVYTQAEVYIRIIVRNFMLAVRGLDLA